MPASVAKFWAVRVQLYRMYGNGDIDMTPFADTHPDLPAVPVAHGESQFIGHGLADAMAIIQDCAVQSHAANGQRIDLPLEALTRKIPSLRVRMSGTGHGMLTHHYAAEGQLWVLKAYVIAQPVTASQIVPPPPPPPVVERKSIRLPIGHNAPASDDDK